MTTILGTKLVTIAYLNGNSEPVEVKAVKLSELPKLSVALVNHDEAGLIGLYTGKPAAWADALTPESVSLVLETGEEMNRGPFASYAARCQARGKVLGSLWAEPASPKPNS